MAREDDDALTPIPRVTAPMDRASMALSWTEDHTIRVLEELGFVHSAGILRVAIKAARGALMDDPPPDGPGR